MKKDNDMNYYLNQYKSIKIESKLINVDERITKEELDFMLLMVIEGSSRECYHLFLYFYLKEDNKDIAEEWFKKFINSSNSNLLWRAFYQLSYLELFDYSYRCLKKAASKGHKKAKEVLLMVNEKYYIN